MRESVWGLGRVANKEERSHLHNLRMFFGA